MLDVRILIDNETEKNQNQHLMLVSQNGQIFLHYGFLDVIDQNIILQIQYSYVWQSWSLLLVEFPLTR